MDLGCSDSACISPVISENTSTSGEFRRSVGDAAEPAAATSKIGKFKAMKESGHSPVIALNKITSQIRKPLHRKTSPINWFPRKKVDSYLNRKIKLLQEVGGMNSTLDETLGDSNPHYSRVLREKMAAREAACKAMEARKAALVEASWCRILRAARIQKKEAEAILLKAEKNAGEAFEAAKAIGVIMYDKPDCPRKRCQIETSSIDGGRSTTHTVTASFETAFDVDKEVAAAVKSAFVRLANCSSLNKEEVKDMLQKISQNPDTGANNQESSEFSSECESQSGSELETVSLVDGCSSQYLDHQIPVLESKQRRCSKKQSPEKSKVNLVDMMLERLRCLQEDELSSLATIVATCGLSAALAEVQNDKLCDPGSTNEHSNAAGINFPRRFSSLGAGAMGRKKNESELPSLDKFLVKRMSKLEKEVQEAKNARKNQAKDESGDDSIRTDDDKVNLGFISNNGADLGSILVKHSSKFEKEIEEAKKNSVKAYEKNGNKFGRGAVSGTKEEAPELPSLDKCLVKRVSRLEKEVQEAKNRRKKDPTEGGRATNLKAKVDSYEQSKSTVSYAGGAELEKENMDSNKEVDGNSIMEQKDPKQVEERNVIAEESQLSLQDIKTERKESANSLEKMLVKPVHWLEKEKEASSSGSGYEYLTQKTKRGGNAVADCESLDKVLVKRVSRLEKEKMKFKSEEEAAKKVTGGQTNMHSQINEWGGLDQNLVKHKSRLEREKIAAAEQALSMGSDYGYRNKTRQGGNTEWESLDKVLVKRVPRLENEKMKANSEEEMRNMKKSETTHLQTKGEEGGLDQILVKHKSRIEREKTASAQQPGDEIKHWVSRKEARERELRDAWGGLSLGNSTRPHLSKLEREKAAWIKAEEEEKSRLL